MSPFVISPLYWAYVRPMTLSIWGDVTGSAPGCGGWRNLAALAKMTALTFVLVVCGFVSFVSLLAALLRDCRSAFDGSSDPSSSAQRGVNESVSGGRFVQFAPIMFAAAATYVITCRFAEFHRYAHLPGPPPSFVWGNLPDLLSEGWGGRHIALGNLLRRYGPGRASSPLSQLQLKQLCTRNHSTHPSIHSEMLKLSWKGD